jgi:acyl-CoA synthetase (AMP-forming)/AMP-acid ligase II
LLFVLLFLVFLSALLTNLLNNTTSASVLVPILIGVALADKSFSAVQLVLPVTLATTCGYSLPSTSGRMALIAVTGLVGRTEMQRNLMSDNLQALTWMFKDQIGKTRERVFAAIPFFHVDGLQTTLLARLGSASELVITPLPKPVVHLMTIIQNEKCSIFPGVPAMYSGIVNSPETPRFKLNSVKVCVSGSAPLPMAIQEKFGEIRGALPG